MSTEDMEAAIISRVYSGEYGHAENILSRLNRLTVEVGHRAAVEMIHAEVISK